MEEARERLTDVQRSGRPLSSVQKEEHADGGRVCGAAEEGQAVYIEGEASDCEAVWEERGRGGCHERLKGATRSSSGWQMPGCRLERVVAGRRRRCQKVQ